MTFIEPLNLEQSLLNNVLGNIEIFAFMSFIFISLMAAKFRMGNLVFAAMIAVFTVIFINYLGNIIILILIGVSIFFYYSFNKMFKD